MHAKHAISASPGRECHPPPAPLSLLSLAPAPLCLGSCALLLLLLAAELSQLLQPVCLRLLLPPLFLQGLLLLPLKLKLRLALPLELLFLQSSLRRLPAARVSAPEVASVHQQAQSPVLVLTGPGQQTLYPLPRSLLLLLLTLRCCCRN